MDKTIDFIIVAGFLILNLAFGIYHGRGINSLKHYALGNRNFSTATIAATIISTWLAGSSFSITTSETYSSGLYFVIPGLGDIMSFIILAYFYAPRMLEFLGNTSVAEAMGRLYGKEVRLITAISGIIPAIANVGMQFTLLATLLSYFGISGSYASIIASIIVITYVSFGGIKSVTFTDLIQFFTFGIVLPIVAFIVWQSLDNTSLTIFHNLAQDPLFDYTKVFDYHNPEFLNTIFLFFFFMIPALDPAVFQRISMAKNTNQIFKSFLIAGIFIFLIDLILNTFIGILLKIGSPNLEITSTNVISYILDTYLTQGFKGIFIIGIMSMIMSTADSYVNAASVLLANDICQSINIKFTAAKELMVVRFCASLIGIGALLISLFSKNLLDVAIESYGFYMPIVSVILILAIFGFRSTSKAALIGMGAGFLTVIIFKLYTDIDGLIPGMIANLLFFMGSHYLLKQPGGWVGIANKTPLELIRFERTWKYRKFIEKIKNFSLLQFCVNNSPKDKKIYVYFGLFCFAIIVSQACSLSEDLYNQYGFLLHGSYCLILIIATIFISYPTLNHKFTNNISMGIMWNLITILLVFLCSFAAIISNLHQIQFSIFMATLITISVLSKWTTAIFILVVGVTASVQYYKLSLGTNFIIDHINSIQLQIVYSLMLISTILIAFIKPKQQQYEESEYLNYYLEQQHNKMQLDLIKVSRHQQEFFNRLDTQCIEIFNSTWKQIKFLENNFKKNTQITQKEPILKIINRLKAGAQYLNDVIYTIKNKITIKPVKTNIVHFTYNIIDEYKSINSDHELQILLENKTNYQEIECDQNFISQLIKSCINHGLMNNNYSYILVTFEDTNIKYDLDPNNLLTIKRNGIKIIITIVSNNYPTTKNTEIDHIVHPIFNNINGVNLTDCYKIIAAHYGTLHYKDDQTGNTIYEITVPAKLSDIRPKKTDLPDQELSKLNEINNFITTKTKAILINIAKELMQTGMDLKLVLKITKLSLKELKQELDI